jgi:predicted DNA-binding transcriptional regulator AlpA
MEKHLWTTDDCASFVKHKSRTLAEWRSLGKGPPYVKLSRRCVRYVPDEVRAWVAQHRLRGTFEDRREARE